jgi:hypothetical protein
VFFSNVSRKPGWKVVLRKEARTKREVDSADALISTTGQSIGLSTPDIVSGPWNTAFLIGAIELSPEETLLGTAGY